MAAEAKTDPEHLSPQGRAWRKILLALLALVMLLGVASVAVLRSARTKPEVRQGEWEKEVDGHYSVKVGNERFFGFSVRGDRMLVPDTPEVHFGANQDFSLEAWIKAYPSVSRTARQLAIFLGGHPGVQRFIPSALVSWVYRHSTDNDFGVTPLLDKHHTPDTLESIGFQMYLDYGRLACQLSAPPMRQFAFQNFVSSGPNLQDRRWHHVALTVQRATTNGGRLYVDGRQVLVFDPTKQNGDLSNSEPLRIGNHANPTLKCFFKGRIGDVAVYRRALGVDEIAASFKKGRSGG